MDTTKLYNIYTDNGKHELFDTQARYLEQLKLINESCTYFKSADCINKLIDDMEQDKLDYIDMAVNLNCILHNLNSLLRGRFWCAAVEQILPGVFTTQTHSPEEEVIFYKIYSWWKFGKDEPDNLIRIVDYKKLAEEQNEKSIYAQCLPARVHKVRSTYIKACAALFEKEDVKVELCELPVKDDTAMWEITYPSSKTETLLMVPTNHLITMTYWSAEYLYYLSNLPGSLENADTKTVINFMRSDEFTSIRTHYKRNIKA